MYSSTFSPSDRDGRSLYVHVPFCRHRCGYCNFTLIAGRDDLIDRFLNAIEKEINALDRRQRVQSVFLGGGTPSHLNAEQLIRLFQIIYSRFDLAESAEVTSECNPNDMDLETARTFASCGINRVSLGVQSFNDDKLKFLERDHTADDVENAVQMIFEFTDNVSLDLIFATQDESIQQWTSDLATAISLGPKHISTYELTIEKGTRFWNMNSRQRLSIPTEDHRAELYINTIDFLQSKQFGHYEISSFCRSGFACRHNENYWNGNEFFAFGPGASRYIGGIRETNHRSTTTYLKKIENGESPVAERQVLTKRATAIDRLVFGLRRRQGIRCDEFRNATGYRVEDLLATAGELIDFGLISIDNEVCKLTDSGLLLYDSVAAEIIE